MAISSDIRRSGPFISTGKETVFPFSFKIISAAHVSVLVSTDGGVTEEALSPSAFTVSLNADQDNQPGGSVKLLEALGKDVRLSIVSDAPYLQPMVLTNRGGFYPETLNDSADNIVIQTQQLNERLSRAITVPATSENTPEQLMKNILDVANHAQEYAVLAADTLRQTQELADHVDTVVVQTGETVKAEVIAVGDEQKAQVVAEGDAQVGRVTAAGDSTLWQEGLGCQEQTWTLADAVTAGTAVTIPNGMQYVVGRHHLRLSWNGLQLFPDENFDEIGTADTMSGKFSCAFDMAAGDVINAWTPALGSGVAAEAIIAANNATDAVAELSRKVVYKDEESAS